VPHDAADGILPAYLFTQYGWRLFLEMFVCTKCTTSGRMGAWKTPGSLTDLETEPSAE